MLPDKHTKENGFSSEKEAKTAVKQSGQNALDTRNKVDELRGTRSSTVLFHRLFVKQHTPM